MFSGYRIVYYGRRVVTTGKLIYLSVYRGLNNATVSKGKDC